MKAPKNTKKKTQPSGLGMPGVDVAQLESLLDFMASHGLEEFEYEHEGLHIRLKKASTGSQPVPAYPSGPKTSAAPVAPAAASTGVAPNIGATVPETAAAPAAEELHIIKSPIVGTFYQSPSPDADAYVRQGDTIRSGQVVCIVEAMKLMNEIEADIAGEIVRVLVEDKQPVEYGQALFSIRPDKKKK
jgi:acetyl-CoA carboxylase biotin carboxyl carrier protein